MKLEEQEKSRKEIQELRRDLERTYQLKSEALINREKNAIERLQKQQEIEEKEIYMQRQLVLKEIDAVRNREVDLRQRTEAFEKGCKLQQEKARAMEELLGRRELAVKTLEETYDQKLKNELTRYQLDLKEEYLQRTQKVAEDERRNKEEKVRLQKEAASVSAKAEEHRQACAELQRLQVALDTALAQVSLLTQQNELLKERLEAARDYPALKRERVELQAQLRLLKKTLEEAQEENHHLRTDLSKPSKEQLVLQTELRRVQNARRLDEEDFENQKQLLQVQLQTEAERCAQLKAQLAECEERTQRVTSHAEDVKMQLRQTQLALENEVLRCPKPSLVDRSVLDLAPDRLVPPDIYVDPAVLRSRAQDDPYGPGRRPQWARSASSDSDTELVAGAKARMHTGAGEGGGVSGGGVPQLPAEGAPRGGTRVRVTPQEPPPPSLLPGYGSSLPFEAQSPELGSSPPRRLSSTPLSIAKRLIRYAAEEDAQSSPVTFRGLSPERQLSPIPHSETGVAASSSTSLPGSPALKSTARGPIGSQKAQEVASSSGSSPSPPEKITLDDLTEPSQEARSVGRRAPPTFQSCPKTWRISLLKSQSVGGASRAWRSITPTSQREGRVSPTSPRVRSATPPETVGSPSVHQQELHQSPEEAGSGPHREEEEDEEMQWELERKRREEKRQQEREEAMERERRELDRLEQEKRLEEQRQEQEVVSGEGGERTDGEREELRQEQEVVSGEGGERTDGEREELRQEQEVVSEEGGERTEEEREELGVGPVEKRGQEDPLQKYMRMVMEGKSPKKEETEGSPEAEILSDEKDNSIAAFSHDDPDEDFW
ncbi:hypothetical protein ANANG_G00273160 [Anguilla anguilla]|uniref:Oral-facial-digital syndrome 1 protein n=1 Tax=Anguilla anguilla TaxID=7936 RepID=A0A9D3LMW5_ANGAN|nr:hypothetical protein ANANG_G00273160 [Anguilla anguilla]